MKKQKPQKAQKFEISIACRYDNKYCDACCLGFGIIWEGIPPNDTYKLDKCLYCHGGNR